MMRRAEWRHAAERLPAPPRLAGRLARARVREEEARLAARPAAAVSLRRNALALSAQGLAAGCGTASRSGAGGGADQRAAVVRRRSIAGQREARARLEGLSARLGSVSYEAVLARGFALVSDARRPSADAGGRGCVAVAALSLRFADGSVAVTAGESEGAPPAAVPKPRRAKKGAEQGSLL